MVREPAVAGKFYPANPKSLRADIGSYLSPTRERIRAIGCVAPHAGYMYSGAVAGAVLSAIEIPELLHHSLPEPHRTWASALDHEGREVADTIG